MLSGEIFFPKRDCYGYQLHSSVTDHAPCTRFYETQMGQYFVCLRSHFCISLGGSSQAETWGYLPFMAHMHFFLGSTTCNHYSIEDPLIELKPRETKILFKT